MAGHMTVRSSRSRGSLVCPRPGEESSPSYKRELYADELAWIRIMELNGVS